MSNAAADAAAEAAAAAADAAAAAADAAAGAHGSASLLSDEEKRRLEQEERERTALLLSVLVRDRGTGRPVVGALVERGRTDASGRYEERRPMPEAFEKIVVRCPTRLSFVRTRKIGEAPFVVRGARTDATIDVDASVCVEPTERKLRRRFAGVYFWGFEQSNFYSCDGVSAEASYYEYPRGYWVHAPSIVYSALKRAMPTPQGDWDSRRVYVEWLGTSTGPGIYGHMGGALYQLDVEALYKVSANIPATCNPPGMPEFPIPPPPPEPPKG
ncbi:MAG: hypothetical protein KA144_01855 [Xanthomonadaceae bacterium]|nr:hypothetical protein [Xanthomonadaceae bacterium]